MKKEMQIVHNFITNKNFLKKNCIMTCSYKRINLLTLTRF